MKEGTLKRFWAKVAKDPDHPTGCWEWVGWKNSTGYGRPRINNKKCLAHRVSLADYLGRPISEGMFVLHSCDNPACVNPAHLREGTNQDNMRDRDSRGRGAIPDNRGDRCGSAKLNEVCIKYIRASLLLGARGVDLAREFRVTQANISDIKHRRSWRHV